MAVENRGSLIINALAEAFGGVLRRDYEKELIEEKKKSKKKKKDNKKDEKKPRREVEEKHLIREGANSLLTYPNASVFSIFHHIRHFVLQNQLCDTFNSRIAPGKGDSSDSEEEGSEDGSKKEETKKMPVVVGLGVKGVFVLIKDLWHTHPELCLKALTEFSNILCGQTPASLKSEPEDTTGSLFELLMEMVAEPVSPDNPVSMQLSSVTSACLLSLVVALGDTGKMLSALAAMLTTPTGMSEIIVKIPQIFYALQTSVQAVLLGAVVDTDWTTQGVSSKSRIETWPLGLPENSQVPDGKNASLAGDGRYLYLHGSFGLIKIGTGYGNTKKGNIYQSAPDFHTKDRSWLGFTEGKLYFFPLGQGEDKILVINPDTLAVEGNLELEADSLGPMCLFSDEEGLGQILAKKEGGVVLRRFTTLCSPIPCVKEKPLQLSQKSLLGIGRAKYDLQESQHTIYQDSTEQVLRVISAKNFAAVQTSTGKLMYTGSGIAFGISGKDVPKGEWEGLELPDKNVKVEHCSCDNTGTFSLVLTDKGVAYFGGINRKGESGEPAGRQPAKATKLKRMAKVKDHIVTGACGAHATCLISKEGKVFMFGELDENLTDKSSGVVTDLLGIFASQVALGKSHTCILTQHGTIFTFGNNLFGQCGRDYVPPKEAFDEVDDDYEECFSSGDEIEICHSDEHKWSSDVCMICKFCGYCTGYGPGCCNQGMGERDPGGKCGCGCGDSGCSVCGCCRVCAEDKEHWGGMLPMEGDEADLFSALKDKIKRRKDRITKKEKKSQRGGMGLQLLFGNLDRENSSNSQVSVEDEKAHPDPVSTKKPTMVPLPTDLTAMQVDCGTFHTAVLLHSGEVYVFGNGNHGQLGQGNNKICGHPVKVPLPDTAIQVACGDNHTIVLLNNGQVYSFGKYQEGQLGRVKEDGDDETWHMIPRPMTSFGDQCKATWVGSQGNQTFIAVDESLLLETTLGSCKVFANSQVLGIVPPAKDGLKTDFIMIENNNSLRAKKFDDDGQEDLSGCGVYVDPEYNILWSYSPKDNKMSCFNPIAANIEDSAGTILSSSICLPLSKEARSSRSHIATNLLSCLSTLATHSPVTIETLAGSSLHKFDKDEFNCVVRFNAHGGGWGYSASSVEAIRFSPDTDVLLGGFGLYGGRGTYNVDMKVFDLGESGGDVEAEGTLMTSQSEAGYSCEKQQTFRLILDKPVVLLAGHWYVASATITSPSGSSSDAGSSGQTEVRGQDKVLFKLKASKLSNNGTDVGSGQIPEILYRIPEMEKESGLQFQLLDKSFSTTVSADGLNAVLRLLEWSWTILSQDPSSHDSQHVAFISKSALGLLKTYIQETYPKHKKPGRKSRDSSELAEAVYQAQTLLRRILSSRRIVSFPSEEEKEVSPMGMVIRECCSAFKSCFHAFYPTMPLKWLALCQHLKLLDPSDVISGTPMENLLSAILEALAEPAVSYIGLGYDKPIGIRAALFNAEPDLVYPILSKYMQTKTMEGNEDGELLGFNAVATKLLGIVTAPIHNILLTKQTQISESPVVSRAGKLLQSRINELALCIAYPESAIMSGLPIYRMEKKEKIFDSSVRFSSKEVGYPSSTVTDVAFSVNKCIVVHGVTVYGGVDLSYSYKVTILNQGVVMTLSEGKFTQGDYYGDGFVNIMLKNTVKLEPELVYTARVELQGSSHDVGVDGPLNITGPGDVIFTFHQTASDQSKADVGPLTKFLYSMSSSSGPQNVVQMSVHLSSSLLEVTVGFLQRFLEEELSLDVLNLLGSSFLFSTLLPTTLAQLGPVACKQPKFAVEVLDLVRRTLPVVSATAQFTSKVVQPDHHNLVHYATVETEHPYKQATVSHFKVKFTEKVQWMSLEFDPRTGFAQKEDKIGDLLIPHRSHTSQASVTQLNSNPVQVISKLIGIGLEDLYADWERYSLEYPHGLVVLPGNEVHIVVNVDTEYEKKDSANHYGLKCQVVGYEWSDNPSDCLVFLEKELSTLGSMCAASLLNEDTVLPFAEDLSVGSEDTEKADMRIVQAGAEEVLCNHAQVLCRGLMVETPNIQQILTGNISVVTESSEQKFLHDFIESKVETPGGRLARWLQPDRAVDPGASELVVPSEAIRTGVSSSFTIHTKDQDRKLVYVEGMKVEVRAVWLGNKGGDEDSTSLRTKVVDTVMGVKKPTFKRNYNPTRLNSNYLFHSISMMMAYSDYSFEELRLFAPKVERSSESMPLKSNNDGTYIANWIPSVSGSYMIQIFIDGCSTGKEHSLEVLETKEVLPDDVNTLDVSIDESQPEAPTMEPSVLEMHKPRMKVFHGTVAPGLRVRSAPSLIAEPLGVIKPGDYFTYVEEIENDIGMWVKLSDEGMVQLGLAPAPSAYALAYSKDRKQEFLEEKEPPADLVEKIRSQMSSNQKKPTIPAKRKGGSGTYHVIQCGSAGHNIRSKPGIKGAPVGRLAKGNKIEASEEVENDDGIWLKLSKESVTKFCDSDTDAWTLAMGLSGRLFLAAEGDSNLSQITDAAKAATEMKNTAIFPTAASVFGTSQQSVFGSPVPPVPPAPSVFQFGTSNKLQFGSKEEVADSAPSSASKPFKFGAPSNSVSASDGDKSKDREHLRQKPAPEKGRPGLIRSRLRRRQRSQSPSHDDDTKKEEEEEASKEEEKAPDDSNLEEKGDDAGSSKGPSEPVTKVGSIAKQALSPAVAECQRAIFAAFLWQENLVYDAMTSATFLKFRPELTKEFRQDQQVSREERRKKSEGEAGEAMEVDEETEDVKSEAGGSEDTCSSSSKPLLPPTLSHLVTFWDEISVKVTESSSLPFPSPKVPTLAKELLDRYEMEKKEIEKRKKDKDKKVAAPAGGGSTVCELCDQSHQDPITYHMKDMHPGCGKHANGWGYNSRGTYCSGWAGNCGDGGRGGSTWYLLCKDCHARYVSMKDDAKKKTVKSVTVPKVKTKKPGKPRNLPVISAIQGMIQNAKFLLEISRSCDSAPPTPQLKSPSVSLLTVEGVDLVRQTSSPVVDANEKPDVYEPKTVVDAVKQRPSYFRSVSEAVKPTIIEPALPSTGDLDEDAQGLQVFRQQTLDEGTTPSDQPCSSLMVKPSRNLRQLIYKRSRSNTDNKDLGYRKVMAFVSRYHDLDGLRASMKQSMRVAGVRAFSMEFLEWLLNKVQEPSIIHDILWQFNCALARHPVHQMSAKVKATKEREENGQKNEKALDVEEYFLSRHPLSGLDGAGIMLQMTRKQFHSLLRTTANIMPKLPVGSAVQQEAMQCYYLQFQPQDHSFLLQSNVFSNISTALSFPEEVPPEGQERRNLRDKEVEVSLMEDILPRWKLKVSSNEAMCNSLTDKSTETFWESRDEPRTKPKQITATFDAVIPVFGVAVHLDNQKDAGMRVEKLTLLTGKDEDSLKEVAKVNVSIMHCGWKTLLVPPDVEHCSVARIEVEGQQNKVRVRQIQVLAPPIKAIDSSYPASVAQQRACEAEALRVFRSLTSQVFGGLLGSKPDENTDETDSAPPVEGDRDGKEGEVREHVVDILFSKGNLSGLQKQVCVHIIQSVHKEMLRMKEEWEVACTKAPPPKPVKQVSVVVEPTNSETEPQDSDSYCFELLSMLIGLSQSEVGCNFLSEQNKLVHDLLTLLHVASLRIQLQICSLLKRILPVIGPKNLAPMINVRILPPLGYSAIAEAVNSAATINQLGLLDCFLAVISKALSVQVKAKGRSTNILQVLTSSSNLTALTLANLVNPKLVPGEVTIKSQRWYLKGTISKEVASEVVTLLKGMIEGTLGAQWEGYAKSAIGQAVLHLTKINEEARMPIPGMFSQTLWLCLSALCVINKEHAEALSSGQWIGQDGKPKSKPLCDNHDDGESEALILCDRCGNLCGECDRVLHYSRKSKDHQRQIFKEEEEAVKVELHEGCGRIKLYWTMALADYRTLKGMIEFKESGSGGGKGSCRFCGTTSNTSLHPIGYVCLDSECSVRSIEVCENTLACGHPCNGVKGEEVCLPCLHGCVSDTTKLKQDADDMCMICYTEGLSCAPCVQLECGHVFHYHCCRNALTKRWSGPRITFRFMFCSICENTPIRHPNLSDVLDPVIELYDDVKRKSMMRLEYENQMKCDTLTSPSSKFYQKPLDYAMWKYAYYVCHKCKKSYCGGEANCAEQISASDDYDPTELVCPSCSNVGGAVQICPKHGTDFLEYKCRFCCSVAVYFCFGTTHFCNPCHDDFQRLTSIAKAELPQCPVGPCAKPLEGTECPLHVKHPPTGEEFALGCGVCRNAQTF